MKIILSSQSDVKIKACKRTFNDVSNLEVYGLKVPSYVAEQPFDDQTITGAANRLNQLVEKDLGLGEEDLYISIENGIFQENGKFIDRAVVVIRNSKGQMKIAMSEGVEFPKACVSEARERGFSTVTVGKFMQEVGLVKNHADPHACLSRDGKTREDFIVDTLKQVRLELGV